MRKEIGIHPAQASVLYALRHESNARFSELLRTTTLTSDVFKFHMRKLVSLGYVTKRADGLYELTARGKEYANRLDEQTGREVLQPKSSMLLIARTMQDGEIYYLAHRRTREPFSGFWGIASAPVLRGVSVAESASAGFLNQTGIAAEFLVSGSFRVIDKNPAGEVLEDKIFTIMVAELDSATPPHAWHGGERQWIVRDELLGKEPLFPTTQQVLDMVDIGQQFAETVCVYTDEQY